MRRRCGLPWWRRRTISAHYVELGRRYRRELKARVHAHRADDMLTAIRIAEEFNLDLTLEHATEGYKITGILAEKGIPVTAGPILFSRLKYELREMTPKNPESSIQDDYSRETPLKPH